MKTKLLILLAYFPFFAFTQNLVVNPSFEDLRAEEGFTKCSYAKGIHNFNPIVKDWQGFRGQTPDIIVQLDSTECIYPKAFDGKAMIGLITYLPAFDRGTDKSFREVVQGKLKEPLQTGKTYYLQFWVSQSNKVADHHLRSVFWTDIKTKTLSTNNIGMVFSPYAFEAGLDINKTLSEQEIYPQFNVEEVIVTEEGEWKKISATFTPSSAFQYFLIGNFYEPHYTQTNLSGEEMAALEESNQNVAYKYQIERRIAYYLIDDIYIGLTPPKEKNIAKALTQKKIYTFKAVNFKSGKYDLLPSSFQELDELSQFLMDNPSIRIEIGGHTDNVGKAVNNQVLSENRAKSARNYLVKKGISSDRIHYKGYGEAQAVASNETSAGRLKNRRVECKILK
jgi:outer membrane protein OmpA-like peptidoglycan-associated protein